MRTARTLGGTLGRVVAGHRSGGDEGEEDESERRTRHGGWSGEHRRVTAPRPVDHGVDNTTEIRCPPPSVAIRSGTSSAFASPHDNESTGPASGTTNGSASAPVPSPA